MHDDISDIAEWYDGNADNEQGRLERHQLEYDLTCRYLDRYLPPTGSILEIGAASGKYTLALAQRGYAVTAVDLSPVILERCRQTIAAAGLERLVQFAVADARDLSHIAGQAFDAVLVMGPLYHLVMEADRRLALQQAYDRIQKGGLIFSSFISRFGVLGDLLKNVPQWIEDQNEMRSLLATGKRPDGYPRGGFRGYFAKLSEIAPLHESAGFETIVLAGVEPAISADDESYNRLQGNQRKLWQDLLFAISAEMSIVAASRHLLYIGRK